MQSMIDEYEMEKWIWTDADFEKMGWHDSQIYAFAFLSETYEFVLDIDYILRWVHPAPEETYFQFWVSPATLVFENAGDIKFDLETLYGNGVEIQDVHRQNPRILEAGLAAGTNMWRWVIEAQEGEISLDATGYKQFFRKKPSFHQEQTLELRIRSGISFHRGRLDM
jgi:hypothetical protein